MIDDRSDVEKKLAGLAARPVPPGMRDRVLGAARAARAKDAIPPGAWLAAAACALLIVAALGADAVLARRQAAGIASLLDGRSTEKSAGLKDWGADLPELAGIRSLVMARAGSATEAGLPLRAYRDLLKGALDHADPEILF
jgi:hypothetical protein